jgi:hypothetical protein
MGEPSHMTKWTKTRRDPGRDYSDQAKSERRDRMLARMAEFLEEGTLEDEPVFVAAVKEANPGITKEQLKESIRLFCDAIYERQQRNLKRR